MKTLRIYSQQLLRINICEINVLIILIMLYITSLVLTYLITGSLYFLTTFIQFPLPNTLLPPPPPVITNLISFSISLFICFLQYY